MKWFRKTVCKHEWEAADVTKTGKLCFSFNCARPQIQITEECKKCGKIKAGLFMSGLPSQVLPLTPEIAGKVLRDEFGDKP